MVKDILTNEQLKNKFKNDFELANVAIALARGYIRKGESKSVEEIVDELLLMDIPPKSA